MTVKRFIIILFILPLAFIQIAAVGLLQLAGGFSPQAQQFFARLPTQPNAATKACYNTAINSIVASGAWTLLDFYHLYSGTPTQADALVNLVQSNYGGIIHGSMTWSTNGGFTGDGSTGYIDTQFIPGTVGANYQLASANIGVAIQTNRTSTAFVAAIGTTFADNTTSAIWANVDFGAGAVTAGMVNFQDTTTNDVTSTTAKGIWSANVLSNVISLWQNAAIGSSKPVAFLAGTSSVSFLVGAIGNGASPFAFSTDQISAVWVGAGLTSVQIATVSNATNTFFACTAGNNIYASSSNFAPVSSASLSSIFIGASTLPTLAITTHQSTAIISKPIPDAVNVAAIQLIGAATARIDCDWQQTEAVAGVYDFSSLDPTITAFRAAGFKIHLVLAYGNTLYGAQFFTGPADIVYRTHYNNWVTAVVNHFSPDDVDVWNEPNIGTGGYAWAPAANATDYDAMLVPAAGAIKVAKPATIVLSAGLAPGTIAPNTFVTSISGGVTTNLDGLGYHPYNNEASSGVSFGQSITDTASFSAAASAVKPIYISEVGSSLDWTLGSETIKANYNAWFIISAIVSQTKEICIYDLFDDGTDLNDHESNFGLFSHAFSSDPAQVGNYILPAGTAYQKLAAAFAGMTTNSAAKIAAANLYQLTINKTASLIRIVGTTAGAWRYTSVEGAGKHGTATDVFGNTVAVIDDGAGNLSFNVIDSIGFVILMVTN